MLHHAGLSDLGRMRAENQDRWLADPDLGLYVVADGMGGEAAGELAAQMVIDTLPALVAARSAELSRLASPEARQALREVLPELSVVVFRRSRSQPDLEGMGSTVVLALVREPQVLIAHVGDSRAYLLREGELGPLTTDHTLVQLLLDSGDISADEARVHPARGMLTQCIGMEEAIPTIRSLELRPGDRLLLCSDGLIDMLSEPELQSLLAAPEQPGVICRRLVDAANAAGGSDNVTALVLVHE